MNPPLYVIFGPPGSGKSLVASFLAQQLHFLHLSWGNLYHHNPEFRRQNLRAFRLIDDPRVSIPRRSKIISDLVQSSMSVLSVEGETRTGLILEGFPRRIEEARALLRISQRQNYNLRALIRINPSFESVRQRLTERKICKSCGQYFLKFNLQRDGNRCPRDGEKLIRSPFSKEAARKEFLSYNRDILKVFDVLRPHAETFFDVSGDDSELEMFSNILTKLRERTKSYPGTYERQSSAPIETRFGTFKLITFQSKVDFTYHLALVKGDVRGANNLLVRIHSSCITGDIFSSYRCECGQQLELAMKRINAAGKGVLIYLFQEGRGINIINKIRAYALQRRGYDTVDANELLGLPAEMREYSAARDILAALRIKSITLMSNNPDKIQKLTDLGIVISGVKQLEVKPNPVNRRYLRTKKERMGHRLSES